MKTEAETRLTGVPAHREMQHQRGGEGRGGEGHGAGPPAASPGANPADARGPADSRTDRERLWSTAAGALFNGPSRCGTAHPTCDSNHVYSPATFIPVKDVQGGDMFREGSPNPGLFKHFSKR